MSNPHIKPVLNPIPVQKFIEQAAVIFNVPERGITGKIYGSPDLKDSRSAITAALRHLRPDISLKKIGSFLNDRHYSTVIYLKDKHEDLLFSDKQYSCRYYKLLQQLQENGAAA